MYRGSYLDDGVAELERVEEENEIGALVLVLSADAVPVIHCGIHLARQ